MGESTTALFLGSKWVLSRRDGANDLVQLFHRIADQYRRLREGLRRKVDRHWPDAEMDGVAFTEPHPAEPGVVSQYHVDLVHGFSLKSVLVALLMRKGVAHTDAEGSPIVGAIVGWRCLVKKAISAVPEIIDGAIRLKAVGDVL